MIFVQSVRLCFTFTCQYLLFMWQERHEHQRFARLDALHHRRGHVDDVQRNIPAVLQRQRAERVKPKTSLNMRAFTNENSLFLPGLPPPQLQPRPVCDGECARSSGTGRCANSRGANFPWGPKVTSGNF